VLDEAHEFRNTGPKHSAALAIMELASIRLVMTATPLQTNTKDLAAMGRLIGIQHFLSPQAFTDEKGWQAMLRRLRRESMDDTKAEDISATDYDPYKSMQCEIAQKIRVQFGDRLLRRTLKSVDRDNRLLIDLPPLIEETFIIELQAWELLIIDGLTAKVAADLSDVTFARIVSTRFYIEYRMGVGYARKDLKDPIPSFKTLKGWRKRKSTKIDSCARICKYLTSSDRAGTPRVEEGAIVFPPVPPLAPGLAEKKTNKILIYQEFPSLGPLLRNILSLYKVDHLWIDGDTDYDKRAAIVKQFFNSAEVMVLIVSSIGAVGLNLSCVNFIIFLVSFITYPLILHYS
ncbi:P-loop containing nucleoside triphosphate hydrolase protein, partial [Crepidotus variabilis]